MTVVDTLIHRNVEFSTAGFSADLKILPSMLTMIVGCVDPRVDPFDVFKLKPGEAVIIRNVGGRVDRKLFQTMAVLRAVAQAAGKDVGSGWNLVILHHTDCGIKKCYQHAPGLLATYLDVSREGLESMAVMDPDAAVALDVAALKTNAQLPGGFMVSGLVYDVATGLVRIVVPPAILRAEAAP